MANTDPLDMHGRAKECSDRAKQQSSLAERRMLESNATFYETIACQEDALIERQGFRLTCLLPQPENDR